MTIRGQKGGGCFVAGTMITTPDGLVPIESVREGQKVLCFDEYGALAVGEAYDLIRHPADRVYQIESWGQQPLVGTPNHWLLNQYNTFAHLGTFTTDDALINGDGHLCPVTKVFFLGEQPVFNFKVHPHHTYIANGIRVHNGGRGIGNLQTFIEGQKGGGGGGKGGGGATVYTPKEDPNTLQSKATARVMDVIGEGEIEGLVNGAKSIFFDGTPLQNDDGSYNFDGVSYTFRAGLPDQDPVDGITAEEADVSINQEITHANPVFYTVTDSNLDAIRVKLRIPSFYHQNTNGDLLGTSVGIELYLSSGGGAYSLVKSVTISGKCVSAYEEDHRLELPAGGSPWVLKAVRTTADSDTASTADHVYLYTVTSIVDQRFIHPNTAYMLVTVDSELFGGKVPQRAYGVKGLKVSIPSNYNPLTRVYTGMWDGTFVTAWTDNPAWCLYDMLTNNRYGLGNYISAAQVDKWGLYTIAQYCDELVDDGFGGTEPRFTLNCVINTRQQAFSIINLLVSVFRGMAYWSTGSVYVSADMPKEPTRLVTAANVVGGTFKYEGSALKARHTVALVSWNDPDDGDKLTVEAVEDADAIHQWGWRPIDVAGFGIRSRGQAHRLGKWILDSEKNETELVYYKAGWDHADCLPGEIVALADPNYAGARFGGRITAVSGSNVTIDSPVVLSTSETYTLMVLDPSGTVQERSIVNRGTVSNLSLTSAFSTDPIVGSLFVISGSDVAPRQFRIIAKKESDKHTFDIVGLFYDSGKFPRVEQNLVFEAPSYTLIKGPIRPPSDLNYTESMYKLNNMVKTRVTLSCEKSTDPRVVLYRWEVKSPSHLTWETVRLTSSVSVEIEDPEPGTWSFRVWALASGDNAGGSSTPVTLTDVPVYGKTAPPENVVSFFLHEGKLYWSEVSDLDLAGYEIRFQSGINNSYGDAAPLHTGLLVNSPASLPLPPGQITLMIKAVDTSGNYSQSATYIYANISGVDLSNVVVTTDLQASGFPGTITNGTVTGGVLLANSAGVFWDANPDKAFWTSDGSLMWTALFESFEYVFTVSPDAVTNNTRMTIDAQDLTTGISLYYRPEGINLMWGSASSAMWSDDDAPMWSAPMAYQVWPGSLTVYQDQLYSFLVKSTSGTMQGSLDTLTLTFDVEDMDEAVSSVSLSAAGTRLPITKTFRAITTVTGITLQQDGGSAVSVEVLDYDAVLGPLVRAFDSTKTPTTAIVDATVRGY